MCMIVDEGCFIRIKVSDALVPEDSSCPEGNHTLRVIGLSESRDWHVEWLRNTVVEKLREWLSCDILHNHSEEDVRLVGIGNFITGKPH